MVFAVSVGADADVVCSGLVVSGLVPSALARYSSMVLLGMDCLSLCTHFLQMESKLPDSF